MPASMPRPRPTPPLLRLLPLGVLLGGCDPVLLDADYRPDLGVVFPGGPAPGGPACADGVRGAAESDVDCGGPSCPRCADGNHCGASGDCASGQCTGSVCVSCTDGRLNAEETDVDCGGFGACPRCPLGYHCLVDRDCAAGACVAGTCAQSTLYFQPTALYHTGSGFAGLALGDIDGDGILDVAGSDTQAGALIVLRGRGDGSFWPPSAIALGPGAHPGALAAGDLDGDGRVELVVLDDRRVLVARTGGGALGVMTWPHAATRLALADLDGDHHLDAVVGGPALPLLGLLRGDGQGGLGAAVEVPLALGGADQLAAGDLDGDGRADVVLNGAFGPTAVLLSTVDGKLRPAGSFAFPPGDNGAARGYAALGVGRFDADAHLDVVDSQVTGLVQILGGDGVGGITPRHEGRGAGAQPLSLAVADFDGDGRSDVAIGAEESHRVQVLLGDGDGRLQPGFDRSVGDAVHLVRAGDLDGDGRPDLVLQAWDGSKNSVAVLLNVTR